MARQSAKVSDPIGIASVVRLRSGGPQMTVEILEGPIVTCVWMDNDGRVCAGKFQSTSLVTV